MLPSLLQYKLIESTLKTGQNIQIFENDIHIVIKHQSPPKCRVNF